MRRGGQVEMGSIPAMVAKPRTSLAEAKRASVIEAPRNSLGHLVAVVEDMSAAVAGVAEVVDKSAVAGGGRVGDMSAAVAAVAEVVDVAVGGDPTFALNKTSYRLYV